MIYHQSFFRVSHVLVEPTLIVMRAPMDDFVPAVHESLKYGRRFSGHAISATMTGARVPLCCLQLKSLPIQSVAVKAALLKSTYEIFNW